MRTANFYRKSPVMIQKYLFLLALCFVIQLSWGQKTLLKEANKAFKANDFNTAIADYKMIENPDNQTQLSLADSYYHLGKMSEAASIYEKLHAAAVDLSQEELLRYANAEKATNNYAQANTILSKYAGKSVNIEQKLAENAENLPLIFELQILDKDSKYSDFGPALLNDQLVFCSDRNTDSPIFTRTQRPFLDLYTATVVGNEFTNVTLFSEAINTPLHEGNAAFTKDGKTIYFTRTNDDYKRINGVKVAVLQLFKADFVGGQWQNIVKLPGNDDSYSMAYPALSADDKTLYFTSDMPGGFGAGDIYKMEIIGNNSYGNPVNLGASVNSEMQEQFPFISKEGDLYFASDRFMGLGGLDLYRSDRTDGAFAEAYNLGETINSNLDDFSLLIDAQQETGYLSSNRSGIDKIYSFTALDNRKRTLTGVVTHAETHEVLSKVNVTLYKGETRLTTVKTDANGRYNFILKPNMSYHLKALLQDFQPETRTVFVDRKSDIQLAIELQLQPEAQPTTSILVERHLDNIYFDFDKSVISQEAHEILDKLAIFMQENPSIRIGISSYTDAVGASSYNKILSEKRVKATKEYLIAKGITSDRLSITASGEEHLLVESPLGSKQKIRRNRRSEFRILKN